MPWDYSDDCFQTLCLECHNETHDKNEPIPIYLNFEKTIKKGDLEYCKKCEGVGWFNEYKHIQNGICFRCWGSRFENILLAKPKRKNKLIIHKPSSS